MRDKRAGMNMVETTTLRLHNHYQSKHLSHFRRVNRIKAFVRAEDGSYTIESLIWIPIYMFIVALMLNVSIVFSAQSQPLRIVQDSNRSYSVGRIRDTLAIEQYVIERVAYIGAIPSVQSQLIDNSIIHTELTMPAKDLMPFSMLHKFFETTTIVVSAQQLVEF